MNANDNRWYRVSTNADAFGQEHHEKFERTAVGADALEHMHQARTELDRIFAVQVSGHGQARQASSRKVAARWAVEASLDAIGRAARVLALEETGVDRRFRYEHRISNRGLVATARAFVQNAAPLAEALAAQGLAANVLADLPGQIDALEAAMLAQASGRKMHVGARAGIRAAMKAARSAVAALDAIASNALAGDPQLLAEWKNAIRVGPSRGKSGDEATPPDTTPSKETKAA